MVLGGPLVAPEDVPMHRLSWSLLAGVFLWPACAPQQSAVNAPTTIAYFEDDETEGKKFRHCTVKIGWEVTELATECGPPNRLFKGSGQAEKCAIYETLQRRSAEDKEFVVVCMTTRHEVKKGRKGKGGETSADTEIDTTAVTDVYRVVWVPEGSGVGGDPKRPR
jgi:hypothetical protein